jgi:heat shock protein HslJ
LNGDGLADAAVLLVENSGGSGAFVYLAIVLNNEGIPENTATTLLGDRVSPEAISIVEGEIVLEASTHAPDDPMCCPSQKTRTTYGLQDGAIETVSAESLTEPVPDELDGTSWILSSILIDDTASQTEIDGEITAVFQEGQLTGFAGCNNYFGNYEAEGANLTLGPIGSTRKACQEAQNQRETEFLAALEAIATYRIAGEALELLDASGKARITLASQGESPLAGTWYWLAFEDSADGDESNDITIADPARYTLEFLADGTYSVKADCNQGVGEYSATGSGLALMPGPVTLAECEPGSYYSEFLANLEYVVTYVIAGDKLYLNLQMDAGNMVFGRNG